METLGKSPFSCHREMSRSWSDRQTSNDKKTKREIKSDCAGLNFLTYKGGLYLNWNDWTLCGFSRVIKSTLVCPYWVSTSTKQQG